MNKTRDFFDTAVTIIIILSVILIVYWWFQLIFGGSPGLSEFNFALFIFLAGLVFKLNREFGETRAEVNNLKSVMISSFNNVRKDINEIKRLIKKRPKWI